MKTVSCPSCGASATNHQNCEFCGSLFVRFSNLEIEHTNLIDSSPVYHGLEEKIREAILCCEANDYVNLYIKLGDKLLFQLSRSSMISNYLESLNLRLPTEFNDGIGVVYIVSSNESIYLQRLLNLEESTLFYQSSEPDNSFFAIDYGKDFKGASLLSSLLLNKVFRINPNSSLTFEIESWSVGNETSTVGKKSSCFIATATMGDYDHPDVVRLRRFRDAWILKQNWGEDFVKWYYKHGEKPAEVIKNNVFLKVLSYLLIVKPILLISRIVRK